MIRLLSLLAVLAALVAAPAAAAPLEAYGKLPTIEDAAISPSGHAVAVIVSDGQKRVVAVQELATGRFLMRVGAGSVKVRDVRWAGDKHVIVVATATGAPIGISGGRREWMVAYSYDLATQTPRPLMRGAEQALNFIFDSPVVRTYRGEPTVFVQGVQLVGGRGRLSLYRYDLDTGRSVLVEQVGDDVRDWIVGSDGRAVAHEVYDSRTGQWALKIRNGAGWREVQSAVAPLDRPYVIGLGRTPQSVLFATHDGEAAVWREVSLETGEVGPPMPLHDDQGTIRDPVDGRMVGHHALVGDEVRYTFFDEGDARAWRSTAAAFPGSQVWFSSWSADRRKIIALVDSPEEGPAYALVDVGTKKATWLGAVYNDLMPEDIAPKQALRFKAADGLDLTGYVTLPRGREAKGLPLVVLPHGGPASRDEPGFDWWAQALASRGYAVLQVNFRGSDGLGRGLLEAGFGQWGRKMQTDLSDGVRHLAAQGVVDPRRVCIVGASYGGYAALAGATHDRGVYRCAASVAGVSDLRKLIAYSRNQSGSMSLRYWTRFMGAEDLGDPVLAELSPALHAARAEIPVLLVHGRDDTVVPLDQSRSMAEALRAAGKPVELVVQSSEDHWLTRGETRVGMLNAVVTFLEKHNPPM
ncbi:alpha/beta hydrolase family protein [Phenylobacterium sp.]|uniref:alpha/beta hydrolase family protein n=1 Tax=Phenylobacterium sp. TaxID=1871053 RepID=UPI002FE2108D